MALLVKGKSNKEIEFLLSISFSTVKNHVYNLYRKIGVTSRAQLIHLVMARHTGQEGSRETSEPTATPEARDEQTR